MKKICILMSLSVTVFAADITLKSGETITIQSNKKTTVQCTGAENVPPARDSGQPACHDFYSDSECRGLLVGSRCKKAGGKDKMFCVSTGLFAGAPNCKCR